MSSDLSCQSCGKALVLTRQGSICAACLFTSLLGADSDGSNEDTATRWEIPGYELIREIGRGSSAVVYEARQYNPGRSVALKLFLPVWRDGSGVRERFRQEAPALAQLLHPGILPVLASGEVDGVPWFSTPLADGGNLADRAPAARGQFRQIAEWVASAADAIAYAHARGVLHRDIKPSNLLFAKDGRLFVADFGLARVLDTDSKLTVTAPALGKPTCMAPEVIAHGIHEATVAAGIWGLGAVLYELLADRPPFQAASIPELVRVITSEPPRPIADAPTDLCSIAFHALQKEPHRRYASIHELADDLRAWLAGEPVEARPHPWWTRTRFAVKSHPVLAGSLGLFLAATIGASLLSVREARLRKTAEDAQRTAGNEAANTREMLEFLETDLLGQASPEAGGESDVKLRTVVDRAAQTLESRFAERPLSEAQLRQTFAWTYLALGEEPLARAQAERAIAFFQREKGLDAPEILKLRHFEAYDDAMQGESADAEKLVSYVLELQRRVLPPTSPDSTPSGRI